MKKPRKPRKPLKCIDGPDKVSHHEKTPYRGLDTELRLAEIILVDDDEMEVENDRLARKFAEEGKEEFDEEYYKEILKDSHPFSDVYCFIFEDSLSESDIEEIKSALPEGYSNLIFHGSVRKYEDNGYVTYDLPKSEEQFQTELVEFENRFSQYEIELAKYEKELMKYVEWKKEEQINKLKKQLEKLEE